MSHHNWIVIGCIVGMTMIGMQPQYRYVDELPRWQRILIVALPMIGVLGQATAIISTAH